MTDRGKEGYGNDRRGALATSTNAKPNHMDGAQRSQNPQAMNKKSIRGRRGGMSWHNIAKSCHLTPEVNGTFGWGRIECLPGEISRALRSVQTESVRRGNTGDDRREVSRGHKSWDKTNWGAEIARLNYETHGTNHPAKG